MIFIIRPISYREHQVAIIKSKDDPFEGEKYILNLAVSPKVDWDNEIAGVVDTLLSKILDISGIDPIPNRSLQEGEVYLTSIDKEVIEFFKSDYGAMALAAISTIPGLTLEQLDNCDPLYRKKYLLAGSIVFNRMFQTTPEEVFSNLFNEEQGPLIAAPNTVYQQSNPTQGEVEGQQQEVIFNYQKR